MCDLSNNWPDSKGLVCQCWRKRLWPPPAAFTPHIRSTTQLFFLSAYLPACIERLFSLVGLLDLDCSYPKPPSDRVSTFARHPRRRGPWSKYTHTEAYRLTHAYVLAYMHTCLSEKDQSSAEGHTSTEATRTKFSDSCCSRLPSSVFVASVVPLPLLSSSPSVILPHSTHKTQTHCNSLTFLWHDLWPSSPQSTSFSCFYTRQEDRACFDGRGEQLDRGMDG